MSGSNKAYSTINIYLVYILIIFLFYFLFLFYCVTLRYL
uniref:Chitin synthase regulator n=1 Tax=Siphoviridae sp. ctbbV81 TaxID=2827900 RepID=A0A8S5TQK9_9CAUD|nr:MAG TPA: chitin synthase regulator [Siphoviridae sp. ctbbV81]DAH50100.1 MAG TPA: chitin synthase regulator [Caudoviricetes sp.]